MHCIVSWDVSEGVPSRNTVEEGLKRVLQPLSWVRALTTFYIVHVSGQPQYQTLVTQLTAVAQQHPTRVHLVISPLMSGGQYYGFLPSDLWPEINTRSTT